MYFDQDLEASHLATALLSGDFTPAAMLQRATPLIEGSTKWLAPFIARVVAEFGDQRPRKRRLIDFVLADHVFVRREWAAESDSPQLLNSHRNKSARFRLLPYLGPSQFSPTRERFTSLEIPRWNTVGELAEWLELTPAELDWFADAKGLERVSPEGPLRHYRYRWVRKRGGGARLIEAPKPRLKALQRRLLVELFEQIPIHPAAHGFRAGRSVRTFVEPHAGQETLLKIDLRNFFPSLVPARLAGLLMSIGYAESVARLLTSLCVNRVPEDAWKTHPQWEWQREESIVDRRLQHPHFPQGAPTSPAIANLIAYRFDCRLAGLARWAHATYTRYADDLLFSGDDAFRAKVERFQVYVAAIALEEGFQVQHRKTRVMTSSQSQRAAGLILNVHPNYPRREYDRLKAALHQASLQEAVPRRHAGHNDFRAHLLGRIQYVRQWNPARADKLLRLFERIQWQDLPMSGVDVNRIG